MTQTIAGHRRLAATANASSGAVSSCVQSVTNTTPSAASRLARLRAPIAESRPPTPGMSTRCRPAASSRRGSVTSTRSSPRWLPSLPSSLATSASCTASSAADSVRPLANVVVTVYSSPWDTTTGATEAYTGSAGQISALTSALTSVDLPFLNSPTTTIVTPVRRMSSRCSRRRVDRSVRPERSATWMIDVNESLDGSCWAGATNASVRPTAGGGGGAGDDAGGDEGAEAGGDGGGGGDLGRLRRWGDGSVRRHGRRRRRRRRRLVRSSAPSCGRRGAATAPPGPRRPPDPGPDRVPSRSVRAGAPAHHASPVPWVARPGRGWRPAHGRRRAERRRRRSGRRRRRCCRCRWVRRRRPAPEGRWASGAEATADRVSPRVRGAGGGGGVAAAGATGGVSAGAAGASPGARESGRGAAGRSETRGSPAPLQSRKSPQASQNAAASSFSAAQVGQTRIPHARSREPPARTLDEIVNRTTCHW